MVGYGVAGLKEGKMCVTKVFKVMSRDERRVVEEREHGHKGKITGTSAGKQFNPLSGER